MPVSEILSELSGLLENSIWITNLANTAALLMQHLPRLNWVGFYLYDGAGELVLGPFQGLPACLKIPMGRGVCGTSAARRETVVVPDVHKFPGHIACDSRSNSEIVVPIVADGRLIGVLDVDSPDFNRFSEEDQNLLEDVVAHLVARTLFPEKLF